jgi:hypothetical protein
MWPADTHALFSVRASKGIQHQPSSKMPLASTVPLQINTVIDLFPAAVLD